MTGRPDTQLAARPCPDDWLLRDDGQIDPEFDTPEDRSHNGRWGDLIAVNADSGEQLTVEAGDRIRLRLVNASNGTVYTPDFGELDATVVAVDGLTAGDTPDSEGLQLAAGNLSW